MTPATPAAGSNRPPAAGSAAARPAGPRFAPLPSPYPPSRSVGTAGAVYRLIGLYRTAGYGDLRGSDSFAASGASAMVYLSRIYTRAGDAGDTALGDGRRVPKDDSRVE